jgi:saposin
MEHKFYQVSASKIFYLNNVSDLVQSAKTSKYEEEDVSSPQCSLCKLVLTYLDAIIENNKTEAAIEAALEKVCTILPSDKKAECVQFVDTYGTKLVELLEKFGSPKLVCMALGLCVKNAPEVPLGICFFRLLIYIYLICIFS